MIHTSDVRWSLETHLPDFKYFLQIIWSSLLFRCENIWFTSFVEANIVRFTNYYAVQFWLANITKNQCKCECGGTKWKWREWWWRSKHKANDDVNPKIRRCCRIQLNFRIFVGMHYFAIFLNKLFRLLLKLCDLNFENFSEKKSKIHKVNFQINQSIAFIRRGIFTVSKLQQVNVDNRNPRASR